MTIFNNSITNGVSLKPSFSTLFTGLTKGMYGLWGVFSISSHLNLAHNITYVNTSSLKIMELFLYTLGLACVGIGKPNKKKVAHLGLFVLLWGTRGLRNHYVADSEFGLTSELALLAIQCSILSNIFIGAAAQNRACSQTKFVKVSVLPQDLRDCPAIPQCLAEINDLQNLICPITGYPIRDPVKDPHDGKIYERLAIVRALNNQSISPCTRQPLTVEQLIECPIEKDAIDAALLKFSKTINNFFNQNNQDGQMVVSLPLL